MGKRLSIEYVREAFVKEGYTLLTETYVSSSQYLSYICPKGHRHFIRWYNWSSGIRCPVCAGQTKPSIQNIKDSFYIEGYILLSSSYKNNKTKLLYICPKGHRHSINWNKWLMGRRCRECSYIERGIYSSIHFIGENSRSWKGGLSKKPYCPIWNDKEYKNSIKERDNYTCQNPYCYHTTDKLVVHHVNYTKTICGPGNLITVCNSCNLRANTARGWHKEWYQTILNKKYGYKY